MVLYNATQNCYIHIKILFNISMVCLENIASISLRTVLNNYGVELQHVAKHSDIPHSFWGAPEAGRINNQLYARFDTPIHSILHESCHFVCMPKNQRSLNNIDAAGSVAEENATCYLQILLSDQIEAFSRAIHMKDMDAWGYSFRLGSATIWFRQDAEDARNWLQSHNIIDQHNHITWKLRQ